MREDSGRVGQLMGDMEGREWKRQPEHLLGLEEQQPHLPPAFLVIVTFLQARFVRVAAVISQQAL